MRPRVGACAASALANRSWTPGRSTTGALLRVSALPPEEVDMLILDRLGLRLVFEDLDAHAIGRHHEGLVKPVVVAREHRHARGFPLGHLLLDVVDDEADMVHHRTRGAALSLLVP